MVKDINELVAQAQQGCSESKAEIVKHCEGIVKYQASKVNERDRADAQQNAFIGLLNAIETFDPAFETTFISWAFKKTGYEVSNSNLKVSPVSISRHRRNQVRRYTEATRKGLQLGLTTREINTQFMESNGLSLMKFEEIRTAETLLFSSSSAFEEFDTIQPLTRDEEAVAINPLVTAEEVSNLKIVTESLEKVLSSEADPDVMSQILNMRVMSDDVTTAEALGKELGMSPQTVIAHQRRLLENLRDHLKFNDYSYENLLEV